MNLDVASLLSNLIGTFQHIKTLHLADCKLSFPDSSQNGENTYKKLFSTIKSRFFTFLFNSIWIFNHGIMQLLLILIPDSKLTDIDVSFNSIGYTFLSGLVENLPESQTEHVNFSNCLAKKKSSLLHENDASKLEFFTSITKFISFSLRTISLRNLNLDNQQTTDIIRFFFCNATKYTQFKTSSLFELKHF